MPPPLPTYECEHGGCNSIAVTINQDQDGHQHDCCDEHGCDD